MEKGLFSRRVYEVVRRIPKGKVATYGQVAALAGGMSELSESGEMKDSNAGASGLRVDLARCQWDA